MGQPKPNIEYSDPYLSYADVMDKKADSFIVRMTDQNLNANVAASCLIQPEIGDHILVSVDGFNRCFILSILERSAYADTPVLMHFSSPVDLHAQGGLTIRSNEDVNVGARKSISMASEDIEINAHNGEICIDKTSFLGRFLSARLEKISVIGIAIDSVYNRMVQKAKSCFRYVQNHEEVRSGSSRHLVRETMTVQSKNSIQLAKEQMKLDADQIHLG